MRCALTLMFVVVTSWTAAADDTEAKKLYFDMEQRVRKAKTLQVRIDLTITDATGQKGAVKSSLTLGEGDKLRLELEGKVFGQAVNGTSVSDGTTMLSIDSKQSKDGKVKESAKGVGAYFRWTLPREGFFLGSLNLDRRSDRGPEQFVLSEFKLFGQEKLGNRNTQVIQYTMREKGGDSMPVKLWVDTDSHVPVKLTIGGGKSDVREVTETYTEFTINPKLSATIFELPK